MKTIMVVNPKDGCGKSTIAVNLAGYLANKKYRVSFVDYDQTGSGSFWLSRRPNSLKKIEVFKKNDAFPVKGKTNYAIIDMPSNFRQKEIDSVFNYVNKIIIPVLPSPIDIEVSRKFFNSLFKIQSRNKVKGSKGKIVKVIAVANATLKNSIAKKELENWLGDFVLSNGEKLVFSTTLRRTQNYNHAVSKGVTIFDLPSGRYSTSQDIEQWKPLCKWALAK